MLTLTSLGIQHYPLLVSLNPVQTYVNNLVSSRILLSLWLLQRPRVYFSPLNLSNYNKLPVKMHHRNKWNDISFSFFLWPSAFICLNAPVGPNSKELSCFDMWVSKTHSEILLLTSSVLLNPAGSTFVTRFLYFFFSSWCLESFLQAGKILCCILLFI